MVRGGVKKLSYSRETPDHVDRRVNASRSRCFRVPVLAFRLQPPLTPTTILLPLAFRSRSASTLSQVFGTMSTRRTSGAVHLVPPLFQQNAAEQFQKSGRTVSFVASGRDNTLAIFATSNVRLYHLTARSPSPIYMLPGKSDPQPSRSRAARNIEEQQIYFASIQRPPLSERRVVSCYADRTGLWS